MGFNEWYQNQAILCGRGGSTISISEESNSFQTVWPNSDKIKDDKS